MGTVKITAKEPVNACNISYSFADNQLPNVKQFTEDGLIDYAGDVRYDDIFTAVEELFEKYYVDKTLREKRSLEMQGAVDGNGAVRVAKCLME